MWYSENHEILVILGFYIFVFEMLNKIVSKIQKMSENVMGMDIDRLFLVSIKIVKEK